MNLKGIKVNHKAFGLGIVVEHEANSITVSFEEKGRKKLQYPGAFDGFLTAVDDDIHSQIAAEIAENKQQKLKENEEKALEIQKTIANKAASFSKKTARNNANDNTLNYAFKCNYCDGGASDTSVGFNGACSDENIRYNIEKGSGSKWCNFKDCRCKQYYNGEITREELDNGDIECYESTIMNKPCFRAGEDTTKNPPTPRHMPGILPGGLCILTTQFPNDKERYIFGAYIADFVFEGDNKSEGYAECKTDLHLMFTREEAEKFKFWDYYENPNNPESRQWGTGLYRKMKTEQARAALEYIIEMKKGTADEDVAVRMLEAFESKNKKK